MLKIIGAQPVTRVVSEGDSYIPLKFTFPEVFSRLPLYWRSRDFGAQLLEIGVNPRSGALCKLTVVGLGTVQARGRTNVDGCAEIGFGVPICDLSAWPTDPSTFADRFRDEAGPYAAFVEDGLVVIELEPATPAKLYRAGGVDFGVAGGGLVSLRFTQLSTAELRRITGG